MLDAVRHRDGPPIDLHLKLVEMSSEPPPPQMRKLSDFTRTFPENDEFQAAMKAFSVGSDGSAILLAGAWLDSHLTNLIIESFKRNIDDGEKKELFYQPLAPLHTLNAKLRLARANGLIAELVYDQSIEISHLRNVFAHSPFSIDCNTPEIALRCNRLEFNKLKEHFLEISGNRFPDVIGVNAPTSGPRYMIIYCSLLLLGILMFYRFKRLEDIKRKFDMLKAVVQCKTQEIEDLVASKSNKFFDPLPHRKWMRADLRETWPDILQPRSL